MTLQQLRYFRTLAKVRHYTRASQELYISQPSLSYSITELEKELGVNLFEKHGKKISLSAQGELFLKYADDSLRQLDEGIEKIKRLNPLTGKINLGYIASLGTAFLPEVLKSFYKDESNKAITFNFIQKLNNALMESLKEGLIDLAFCPNPYKDVESVPVMRQDLYLVVPKGHRYAEREEIDIREVKNEPFILTNKQSGLRHMISGIFKEMMISPNIAFEAEECGVAITFVALNYGLAIIPKVSSLENSEVSGIKIKNPEFSRIIYMAWMPSRNPPPVVKKVKDFIINQYSIPV
jgi:DNA-binding transcriptional LysR family regulator